tara:strand:- start:1913 stop:2914 length:1002 start_codon:yes stop_codon:yes gene_type:complete
LIEDSKDLLQHPRRNLGNRYRSQAKKFTKLATMDESRFNDNIGWAEQSARQAILHDFTDENNWRCLADIKVIIGDGDGLSAVLEDLFSILGRDPEQIEQLKDIDFLKLGLELLEAAFARDPLNPDVWWQQINSPNDTLENLSEFVERCKRLDFRDQRANIIFGRRIERIRDSGQIDLFIDLARNLLAHRPQNHELWLELGRLYERLNKTEEAWICYDHVQTLRSHSNVRDEYMNRLTARMDGEDEKIWTRPPVSKREEFLEQMVVLARRVSTIEEQVEDYEEEVPLVDKDEQKLIRLLSQKDFSEAFFVARRLVAQGENWAEQYMEQARLGLD